MSEDMDVTARVRAHSGRPMWNNMVIQDAPPADGPVPPPLPAMFPPSGRPEIHTDSDEGEWNANDRHVEAEPEVPAPTITVPDAELVIVDAVAKYKGRAVVLEKRDVRAITRLVVQAAHRETTALLKELGAVTPRKRKKTK
jgi:hypothetical protein